MCVRRVCAQGNCELYIFTYCRTFPVCLFFFINAPVFWSKTMSLTASGNYLQKCSWLNSLGFTVNPEADNGLAWQLFVLAGYFQPNSCTVSLSASYHGRHSHFWHTDTSMVCVCVSLCVFVHLFACMHLRLQIIWMFIRTFLPLRIFRTTVKICCSKKKMKWFFSPC